MLNQDNTELLVLHVLHRSQPPLEFILVCSNVIHSSNSAKDIGAWFDTVMYMDKQINSNIAQISKRTAVQPRCHLKTYGSELSLLLPQNCGIPSH